MNGEEPAPDAFDPTLDMQAVLDAVDPFVKRGSPGTGTKGNRGPGAMPAPRVSSARDRTDLDVIVFGATGVTGRRVAAYLAEQALLAGPLGGCRGGIRTSSSACSPRTGWRALRRWSPSWATDSLARWRRGRRRC